MSGDSDLQAIIGKVRALGTLPEDVAKAAAPGVVRVVKQSAAAGRSPNGQTWAPGSKGQPVLGNAAAAVDGVAVGATIELRLIGSSTGDQKAQAIQHYGTKRIPARPILPELGAELPKAIVAEVTRSAQSTFNRVTGVR